MSSLRETTTLDIRDGVNIENVGFVKVQFQTYEGSPGSAIPENKSFHPQPEQGVIPNFHFSFGMSATNESFEMFFDSVFGSSITTIKL
jgi:hypothetical protein